MQSAEIIEGAYRVVAVEDLPRRRSPNRRRAAARIAVWSMAALVAVAAVPIFF